MIKTIRWPLTAAGMALALWAGAAPIKVEISDTRSASSIDSAVQARVKAFGWTAAGLTRRIRTLRGDKTVFSMPVKVLLTQKGRVLPMSGGRAAGDISLQFDASGDHVFPSAYRDLLQQAFDKARPAMNALFGAPKTGQTIKVLNYDADLPDRLAITGGYYVPNAAGGPEIRFPVYNSSVSASINFIHTLLLAYQADASYPTDAWNEGLVRAAVMAVARTPGSLPGSPAADEVEQTLDSLYDAAEAYDWNNQPGLAAEPFIAPNLLSLALPVGGSTGGPYLLRYQMAGTAWAKILAQAPGFIAELNRRFYLSPSAYQTEDALASLGQTALQSVTGSASPSVEGLSFTDWLQRQAILDPSPATGLHTVVQAFSIVPESGTADFGVFGLVLHATRLQPNGDEVLLSGRSYPVYWTPDNYRFFATTQDDIIDVAGGFGSVAPNFPQSAFDGQVYRIIVDVPFLGQTARTMIPAGAVATGQSTASNDVFGVLAGFPDLANGAYYRVRLTWTGGSQDIVVNNLAFGAKVVSDAFDKAQSITLQVFLINGSTVTEAGSRIVSKSAGPVGLILRPSASFGSFTLPLASRLSLCGVPLQPFRPYAPDVLGLASSQVLAASWNSRQARWDSFPTESAILTGQGWAVRPPSAVSPMVKGIFNDGVPVVSSLQPGWNLVSAPYAASVPTARVQAAAASDFFSSYTEAVGTILGPTLFGLAADPDHPDGGTYQPVTSFEPGQGVFVKCLRAEGGALAFMPDTVAVPSAGRSRSKAAAVVSSPAWLGRVTLVSYRSAYSWAEFGQQAGASLKADALDSDLPPSGGGLQVRILASGAGFRDLHPLAASDAWSLRLENLVPGRAYTLSVDFPKTSSSMPRRFTLQDLTSGLKRTAAGGFSYQFRAASTAHVISLTGAAR